LEKKRVDPVFDLSPLVPLPVVALIGRPNVGKSTLFNRLTRTRAALVADRPGLTRDRHYGQAQIGDVRFIAIDTGGFEPVVKEGIVAAMARQTRLAIVEADVVIFVVDARDGLSPHDQSIVDELRRSQTRVFLAVNKAEGLPREQVVAEFWALGLGQPYAISSAHGDGVRELMDLALEGFAMPEPARSDAQEWADEAHAQEPEAPDVENLGLGDDDGDGDGDGTLAPTASASFDGEPPDAIEGLAQADAELAAQALEQGAVSRRPVRIAIVGRPNVGKSTLVNTLLGEERMIAFDQPGTTRDAVAVPFLREGRPYVLIDTAGVRRRGKVTDMIEKFSVVKTLQAIDVSHVVVLMLDARDGVSEQDAHIASFILESGRALVVAVNKWDGLDAGERERVRADFERKLYFLRWARTHFVSALKGFGVSAVFRSVDAAYAAATRKLATPRLTRAIIEAVQRQAPPRRGVSRPKLRFAHQGGRNPPVIVIHGNSLSDVPETYRRYLEGVIRDKFDLEGTPMRIEFRTTTNPFAH
jgi:GTP-binding protein